MARRLGRMHKVPSIVEKVVAIAAQASEAVLAIYKEAEFAVVDKADEAGPLTEADLQSNAVICRHLNELTPEIPILSEELVWQGGVADRYWAVDPLDGTKEFLKRNGEFTVNIALVEHGRPTLGVVMAPASGETWVGVLPTCSLWVSTNGRVIHDETNSACGLALKREGPGMPWRDISAIKQLDAQEPVRVVGSRSHPSPKLDQWLAQLKRPAVFVEKGSSIKLCLVAEGSAHVYPRLGPTSIWDTAAGHAVALASGASVMSLNEDGASIGELFYLDATQTLNPFFMVASPAFLKVMSNAQI